jgi:hypothetical protein
MEQSKKTGFMCEVDWNWEFGNGQHAIIFDSNAHAEAAPSTSHGVLEIELTVIENIEERLVRKENEPAKDRCQYGFMRKADFLARSFSTRGAFVESSDETSCERRLGDPDFLELELRLIREVLHSSLH